MSQSTDRTGLYILVFLTLLNSCGANIDAGEARKELKRLSDSIQQLQPATR